MILDKTAITKWGGKNKKYYISKGYNFTKIGDLFEVKIEDLLPNTEVHVNILCTSCKNVILAFYPSYLRRKNIEYICSACYHNNNKIKLEDIREKFNSLGLILLTKEYKNAHTYLQFKCKKHFDKGIFKSTWHKLGIGCPFCRYEQVAKTQYKDFSEIVAIFSSCNYKLISTENDYKGVHRKLKYICLKHKDMGIQKTTPLVVLQYGGCKYCSRERVSGVNSRNWKGGITQIISHLRSLPVVIRWKKDSMKYCNYKCVITGKKFHHIHHLYSFLNIISELKQKSNIVFKRFLGEYSKEELDLLEKEFIKVHEKQLLGVCLSNSIHNLFHFYYCDDVSLQDFEEFKKKIISGEIKV